MHNTRPAVSISHLRAALCCVLLALSAPLMAHGTKAGSSAPKSVLQLDESTFWDGGTAQTARISSSAMCGDACPVYTINLAPGARRLRVGLDTPERSDTFALELIDPAGTVVVTETNSNQFNSEAMALDPVAGLWSIRVRPENVSNASFRMRAKLESVLPEDLPATQERAPMLPNLRTVPPYEFTFIAPANPLNGVYPPDTVNPPLAVGDIHPISCTVDEAAPVALGGANAKRCLRFTSGPMNLGPGIYDMRFSLIDDFIAGTAMLNPQEALSRIVIGPMQQVIHYSDGSTEIVQAGTYSFHPVHAHFHDDYVLSFELYAVTDAEKGELVRAGEGTKSGFCPADQLFADWTMFNQGYEVPGGDTAFGSCFSPNEGVIGLSIGWGDVYRWQRPGMYVEFDGMANGRYVVRSIVDANNHVIEGHDDDNFSYAYIEVQGDTIELLERGWGESPWDPAKTVFDGAGPAQRDIYPENKLAATSAPQALAAGRFGGALVPGVLIGLIGAAFMRRQRTFSSTRC